MSMFSQMYRPIIEHWLTVKDLVTFDAALCNRTERIRFYNVLKTGVMIKQANLRFEHTSWLIARNVFVNELRLEPKAHDSCSPRSKVPNIEPAVQSFFCRLKILTVTENHHDWLAYILFNISNSTILLNLTLNFIDANFPKKKLQLNQLHLISVFLPSSLQLLDLHQCVLYSPEVLRPLLAMGTMLNSVTMRVADNNDHMAVLALLRSRGLQLTSLSLEYPCTTDVATTISANCPSLTNLSLTGFLIGCNFGSHLRKCTKLTALNLCGTVVSELGYFASNNVMPEVKRLSISLLPGLLEPKSVLYVFATCQTVTYLDLSHCSLKDVCNLGLAISSNKKCNDSLLSSVMELNLSQTHCNSDVIAVIHICDHLKVLNLSHNEWVDDAFIEKLAENDSSTIESIDLTCCHGYTVHSIVTLVSKRCPVRLNVVTKVMRSAGNRILGVKMILTSVRLSSCCVSCQDNATMKYFRDKMGPEKLLHVKWNECPLGFLNCIMRIN